MRLKLTLIFLACAFLQSQAQQQSSIFTQQNDDLSWVELAGANAFSANNYFAKTYQDYGLQSATDMRLDRTEEDRYGWKHHRFQQHFQGVPVEGNFYILHEQGGAVRKGNGQTTPNLHLSTQANISPERAIDIALNYHPAQKYQWEVWGANALLQQVHNDPTASHYPQPELVIVDRAYPEESGRMALAYKMTVYSQDPLERNLVYIDAQTGNLIQSYNTLHTHGGVEGTAITRYHGTQTINTTLRDDGVYILRDDSRGVRIETYDVGGTYGGYDGVDFEDGDNFWDNVNANQDEVATDAHFGAEATFDFFKENFDRNSFDDSGSPLISNVHFGNNFVNAFWDGTAMTYGDGDGVVSGPLTAIDVCGHEIAHGVTEFSAGLIYANESGALNESFSDIFGKAIEKIYMPDDFTWYIGGRMMINNPGFRNMADPNSVGDPKTYQGIDWFTGSGDNGGVHTNSGVQNYWFYALVEGDEGTTESGLPYKVPQIGLEPAMQIAYRNLVNYLTPSSNYADAREGSLQAAADLYGYCSETYLAVASAWFAVGVGYEVQDNDFLVEVPEESPAGCDIEEWEVTIDVYNNACNTVLTAGTNIPVRFQLNNNTMVDEVMVLDNELEPGERQTYTFSTMAQLSGYGEHLMKVWIDVQNDAFDGNDYSEYTILNRPYQNSDFSLLSVGSSTGVCGENDFRFVFAEAQYQGCETLPPTDLPYTLYFKGLLENEIETGFVQLSPFTTIEIFGNYIYSEYGFGDGEITLAFPNDPNEENNVGRFFIGRLRDSGDGWVEDFSATGLDSTYFSVQPQEETQNQIVEINGDYALATTGGEILDDFDNLKVREAETASDFLRLNRDYMTSMDICIDVQEMDNPHLYLSLAQTNNTGVDYSQYGLNPAFSTVMGVYLDGRELDVIHNENPGTAVEFVEYEYDLTSFRDATHNIEFRGLSLTKSVDMNGQVLLDGDNNIIGRVWITEKINVSTQEAPAAAVVEVLPNPSDGQFTLSKKGGAGFTAGQLQIFDAAGKHLNSAVIDTRGQYHFGQELQAGIYFVRVIEGDQSTVVKIVKQ